MIEPINTYGFGAHILDGPTGPMGIVKPGIVKMAFETGAWIVPFRTQADNAWFFNSWDRFMLPKPFSRVRIFFSPPIQVTGKDEADFDTLRRTLEQKMTPWLYTKS